MLAVSTAGAADSLRVYVWRKLRGLGAVYVQQSVCLLPDRPTVAATVRRLVDKVRAGLDRARAAMREFEAAAPAAETDPGADAARVPVRLRAVEGHHP